MTDQDDPIGQEYRGPSGIARNSPWLTNEDIPHDSDTAVEISGVFFHRAIKFQAGRTEENRISLAFAGKKRRLVINATNRNVLNKLFSPNTDAWFGKRILLFVEQGVRRPDGEKGPAVRIRARRVPQQNPPDETTGD